MKNIPNKIYLQIDNDEDTIGAEDFNQLDREYITWCANRISNSDIEYALAPPPLRTNPVDRELTIGSLWQHYKGNIYEITSLARREHDHEPMVLYRSINYIPDEIPWVRPVKEFLEILSTDEGTCCHRFEKVSHTDG